MFNPPPILTKIQIDSSLKHHWLDPLPSSVEDYTKVVKTCSGSDLRINLRKQLWILKKSED